MQPKMNYQNSTKDELIKVQNIYKVRANRYVPINSVQAGDIIAIQTKQATAGSTIISASDEKFVLSQLQLPQCVFFANLEYESAKDKPKLHQALQQLQLEDDSLKITTASEGTTITIGSQGELHLEIIMQGLKEDFGLNTQLKKVQVAVQKQDVGIKYIKNPCKFIETEVITDDFGEEKAYHINSLQFPQFYALEQQIQGSLNRVFLKCFQMHGIRATILDGHYYIVKRTTELAIGKAVQKLMADIVPQLKINNYSIFINKLILLIHLLEKLLILSFISTLKVVYIKLIQIIPFSIFDLIEKVINISVFSFISN